MRRIVPWLVVLFLAVGCTPTRDLPVFTNDGYHYSVSYPSSWQVNSVSIAPPPPAGTVFATDTLQIGIVVQEP